MGIVAFFDNLLENDMVKGFVGGNTVSEIVESSAREHDHCVPAFLQGMQGMPRIRGGLCL
jgi:hypothetical protein